MVFETFKKLIPASINSRLYITDKDMTKRKAIKEVFQNINLSICLFHTLKTFNREITCEKQCITPSQRDQCKKVFQDMCYATTEDCYFKLYEHLQSVAPSSVLNYFNKNWHFIKNEWVSGLTKGIS